VFNLGGPEIMVILLMALIVLGPAKLPEAARTVGRFTAEVRRMSNGFRSEMKAAFDAETVKADAAKGLQGGGPEDDGIEAEARARGAALTAGSGEAAATAPVEPEVAPDGPCDDPADET
jgi:sec-independent protein translocase protein TatB